MMMKPLPRPEPANLAAMMAAAIARHDMFHSGDTVVVGASGGPDSTALLHALAQARDTLRVTLIAAHLHHGIRGAEADDDATYVEKLCAGLDVPCVVDRADVPARRLRTHTGIEEAARDARHAFLRRIAAERGAQRIAIAHTADDRVESVLLNLLRGSGLRGLAGFPAVAPPIVRPLYDVTREMVVAYCSENDLNPREDRSNDSLTFRRNRVRSELLPYLASYFNANVRDAILRVSEFASADNDLLDRLAKDAFDAVATRETAERVSISLAGLLEAHPALRGRVLRAAIAEVRGSLNDVGSATLSEVLRAVETGNRTRANLPVGRGVTVCVDVLDDRVVIGRLEASRSGVPWSYTLNVPGVTIAVAAGWRFETELKSPFVPHEEEGVLFVDANSAFPFTVRSRRPGDRIRPMWGSGSIKLQDLMVNRKIPAASRDLIPVLVDANGTILAVVGVVVGEGAMPSWSRDTIRSSPTEAIAIRRSRISEGERPDTEIGH